MIHVLGNSANMDEAIKFCKKFNLILIEDCCESLGSHFKKKNTLATLAQQVRFLFILHIIFVPLRVEQYVLTIKI